MPSLALALLPYRKVSHLPFPSPDIHTSLESFPRTMGRLKGLRPVTQLCDTQDMPLIPSALSTFPVLDTGLGGGNAMVSKMGSALGLIGFLVWWRRKMITKFSH